MKTVKSSVDLRVPADIKLSLSAKRTVIVEGTRGTLTRSFPSQLQLAYNSATRTFTVTKWFGSTKENAGIKSVISHVQNMITGVTKGFQYKLRFAYNHFPVNVTVPEGVRQVEIRNFLGEKIVRKVPLPEGVTAVRTDTSVVKDELVISGNDIEAVSQTAASVHDICLVKNKDIRKFLDGIYVSEKGHVDE
eukprot:NODE_768_length_781_cov_666.867486_g585_i0.p1 GENE.NODE_768_length_781_cov_666.867486_g585_i0~~NODE_768_length_781_cov_666.867486_g585_i0.p1  ORF type:complete len:191 (+),score=29.17 NODE_768_length_781_cov_666.867486_g585_i0:62-634(+)